MESDYKQALSLVDDAEDSSNDEDEVATDKDAAKEKVMALKNTLSKLKDNVVKEAAAAKSAAIHSSVSEET